MRLLRKGDFDRCHVSVFSFASNQTLEITWRMPDLIPTGRTNLK